MSRADASPPPHSDFAWVPIGDISKWDKNPRQTAKNVKRIEASLKRFGFVAPCVVWGSRGLLVAGHTRVAALGNLLARKPEYTPKGCPAPGLVPVRFAEFKSDEEAKLYAIADNKLTELGEWDDALLAEFLGPLMMRHEDAADVAGFTDEDIAKLLKEQGGGLIDGADDQSDDVNRSYDVIVTCNDEGHQRDVIAKMIDLGLECRALT